MYNRSKIKETKQLFYTSFGKYISRERSSSGLKVKWINYETGIKSIFVRLDANQKNAKALSKQLYNRGFKNAKIIGKNESGLIRVAADSFYTEEEAHLVLENIKNQLSSAWVLNKNKP